MVRRHTSSWVTCNTFYATKLKSEDNLVREKKKHLSKWVEYTYVRTNASKRRDYLLKGWSAWDLTLKSRYNSFMQGKSPMGRGENEGAMSEGLIWLYSIDFLRKVIFCYYSNNRPQSCKLQSSQLDKAHFTLRVRAKKSWDQLWAFLGCKLAPSN